MALFVAAPVADKAEATLLSGALVEMTTSFGSEDEDADDGADDVTGVAGLLVWFRALPEGELADAGEFEDEFLAEFVVEVSPGWAGVVRALMLPENLLLKAPTIVPAATPVATPAATPELAELLESN